MEHNLLHDKKDTANYLIPRFRTGNRSEIREMIINGILIFVLNRDILTIAGEPPPPL
jgi:hypothetical protein